MYLFYIFSVVNIVATQGRGQWGMGISPQNATDSSPDMNDAAGIQLKGS